MPERKTPVWFLRSTSHVHGDKWMTHRTAMLKAPSPVDAREMLVKQFPDEAGRTIDVIPVIDEKVGRETGLRLVDYFPLPRKGK